MSWGSGSDATNWVGVDHLPPRASELARRLRQNALVAFGLYGFAVAVAIFFALFADWIAHPIDIVALALVLAGLGALQGNQFRSMNRREARQDSSTALHRVGSTPTTLLLEGEGRTEIPWAQVGAPELAGPIDPIPFRLPYEGPDGERRTEALGGGELVAILQLPNRPAWPMSADVRARLDQEFRDRGRDVPAIPTAPPALPPG